MENNNQADYEYQKDKDMKMQTITAILVELTDKLGYLHDYEKHRIAFFDAQHKLYELL